MGLQSHGVLCLPDQAARAVFCGRNGRIAGGRGVRRDCVWVLLAPGIPWLDSVSHVGQEVSPQCGTGDGGEHEEDRGKCGGHGIGR